MSIETEQHLFTDHHLAEELPEALGHQDDGSLVLGGRLSPQRATEFISALQARHLIRYRESFRPRFRKAD
jgi:hypothetical protein